MKPAIVLGSHTMGLGVIRALGAKGVPVIAVSYESKDMGHVSKYVVERVQGPHPEHDEDGFLELLRQVASRFDDSILFPVSDESLKIVSKNKPLLEDYYTVACTEWAITEQFIDKKFTYSLAESLGVPAPRTYTISSREDIDRYHETIVYPCLLKPSQSHRYFQRFGRKMVKIENSDQLMANYQGAAEFDLEVMLQELIPGDDSSGVNYNSYFWEGQPIAEFTAQKLRGAPVELGSPCVAVSKQIPEVIAPGRKILKAMKFYGYSCTEFKKDPRDGEYKLMEVNGRHNLSTLLAVRCGLNFPWIHYSHLAEGKLLSGIEYREGVNWIDLFRDVSCFRAYTRNGGTVSRFVKPYTGSRVFAVLDLRDPRPFIARCEYLVKQVLKPSGDSL